MCNVREDSVLTVGDSSEMTRCVLIGCDVHFLAVVRPPESGASRRRALVSVLSVQGPSTAGRRRRPADAAASSRLRFHYVGLAGRGPARLGPARLGLSRPASGRRRPAAPSCAGCQGGRPAAASVYRDPTDYPSRNSSTVLIKLEDFSLQNHLRSSSKHLRIKMSRENFGANTI